MNRSVKRALVGSLACLFAVSGCKRQQATPTPAASASASASGSAAAAAPAPAPPGADPELWGQLTAITTACKVDEKEGLVNCSKGEQRKLIGEFVNNQRSRIKSLPTFTAALQGPDLAVRAVASNILFSGFRSLWGSDLKTGAVNAGDATALLTASLALPKSETRQTLPAAVHACVLAGQLEPLYAAIDQNKDPQVRAIAARHLMAHGRLQVFDKVKELAKDPEASVSLAALESPQNMPNWTAEDQAAICPWATELLGNERTSVANKAASLLGNCNGVFVDKLEDIAEKALKEEKFTIATLSGIRDLCAPARRGSPTGPSEAQCKRAHKILAKVTEAKGVDPQTRSLALVALSYQWPDDETLKLAKRLSKSTDKGLAEHATRTVERIERSKQLTKGAPGASPSAKPNANANSAKPPR